MYKRTVRWTNCTPDPVASPPYSYGAKDEWCDEEDVFKKDDIPQATPCELSDFFSGRCVGKEPTKKWYTTQLELYGVSFKKTASRPQLREALELAYNAGKCEDLTPPIAAIRDRLRNRFDDAWKDIHDEQFAKCNGDIQQEAYCDPPRFVAKYFLDDRGKPDRSKTKDSLSFRVWTSVKELREVAADIPGLKLIVTPRRALIGWEETMQQGIETELKHRHLHIDSEGHLIRAGPKPSTPVMFLQHYLANSELPNNLVAKTPGLMLKRHYYTCVIGWDASRVDAEIARMVAKEKRLEEEEAAREKLAKQQAAEENRVLWHKRCQPHRDFVAKLNRSAQKRDFGLRLLPGRYIVRREADGAWTDVSNPWEEHDEMRLNIFPPERNRKSHGLKASFSFGNIEGTMLLAMSRDKVVLLREAQPKDWRDNTPDGGDDEELDEEAGTVGSSYVQASVDVGFVSFPTVSRSLSGGVGSGGVRLGSSTGSSSAAAGAKRPATDGSNQAATTPASNSPKQENVKQERTSPVNLAAIPLNPRQKIKKEEETTNNTAPGSSATAAHAAPSQQPARYRVFFQFAYNMVDGYPDVDEKNKQIGHFDFDERATTAEGVFRAPALSEKVQRLTIFKVSDQPNREEQPTDWFEFDGRRWGSF
ncbi:hypothetical protein V8F20_001830 [Naviculisporaceae sp. PSN 640]